MANQYDLQAQAISGSNAVWMAHIAGAVDTDVQGLSNLAGLTTSLLARLATLSPDKTPLFDQLIQACQQSQNLGILTDTIIASLSTFAAVPFVAGVSTDLLSVINTNGVSTFNPETGFVLVPPAFSAVSY
jgi:hypothetical protein